MFILLLRSVGKMWPLGKLPRHRVASPVSGPYDSWAALTWISDESSCKSDFEKEGATAAFFYERCLAVPPPRAFWIPASPLLLPLFPSARAPRRG